MARLRVVRLRVHRPIGRWFPRREEKRVSFIPRPHVTNRSFGLSFFIPSSGDISSQPVSVIIADRTVSAIGRRIGGRAKAEAEARPVEEMPLSRSMMTTGGDAS